MNLTKPNRLQRKYQAVVSVLDQLDVGLCIAIGNGKIIVRNAEADRILEHSNLVRLSSTGKIHCCQRAWNKKLQQAIKQANKIENLNITTNELLIPSADQSDRDTLLLDISSLQDNELHPDSLSNILITMIEPYHTGPLSLDRTVFAFQLTETEATICNLLIQGYTNREMAEKRGVSSETVKSQIKSVMRKTRCNRRADLIRLTLRMSLPF